MSKRIVICADGTWNTPDQKDEGVVSPTNVARLAMCVAPFAEDGRRQLLYYESGVGTRWYDRIRGKAWGQVFRWLFFAPKNFHIQKNHPAKLHINSPPTGKFDQHV
jgi:hypothetical protein